MFKKIKDKVIVAGLSALMGTGILFSGVTMQGVYAEDVTEEITDTTAPEKEDISETEAPTEAPIEAGSDTKDAAGTGAVKESSATLVTEASNVKNGWVYENGGFRYYKNGNYYTGWHQMGKKEGEKTTHWSYFGSDGKVYTGWRQMGKAEGEKNAHWSYFGSNGWLRTGWVQFGKGTSDPDGNKEKHWSYFGSNGWLRTGWVEFGKGSSEPDGNKARHWSYFGSNGWLRTGWIEFGKGTSEPDGNKTRRWSYFGSNGWLRTGWIEFGKGTSEPDGNKARHWSYFGSNGWLRTGWIQFGKGTSEPDGNSTKHWSYFGGNGWLTTEWKYFSKEDGENTEHYSYFGSNGWMRTGNQSIGGKNYTFNGSGWMTYPQIMQVNTGSGQAIEKRVAAKVSSMSLEEKVAQMFIVEPSAIGGYGSMTTAGDGLKNAINSRPVGGFIYFKSNLQNPSQTRSMLSATNNFSKNRIGLPAFLCVDEEGGTVARIANNSAFGVSNVGSMRNIGNSGNTDRAYNAGSTIGGYLKNLGFNVDFAPVADVLTNTGNTDVINRVFGTDTGMVSNMAASVSNGIRSKNVLTTYKHFPGNGSGAGDTHEGFVYSNRTMSQISSVELVPFRRGAQDSVPFIMVGHTAFPKVTGNETPSSLSYTTITEMLRYDLGYSGIIISDSMQMGAIIKKYSAGDAAVNAIKAGVDMVLLPNNFNEAYNAVLNAVRQGKIPVNRIDESVTRIVRTKMQMK